MARRLVLGPLLRYVDDTTATIWVETDSPCQVSVLGSTSRTFTVHGHHYAVVDVEGLSPGSSTAYTVELDGETAWPFPGSPFPPSRIRTLDPAATLRLVIGSCRRNALHDSEAVAELGYDGLRAYGQHLTGVEEGRWPAALLLIGDQVYADAVSASMRDIIVRRRDPEREPGWEIADFEEYTQLYRLTWTEPTIRWLLSTVPSMMIFDDHDIRDDWNISRAWLDHMQQLPWWRQRLTAGLGAYWIYQHLGNLAPKERGQDPIFDAVCNGRDDRQEAAPSGAGTERADRGELLDELIWRADQERDGRWNYARDIGRTRILVADSRGGRVHDPGQRLMLGPRQLKWFDEQARGDIDHLLVATSIPYLLPYGIHHVEAWNEALCDGAWGSWVAEKSERFRQDFDLEHWASFQYSFSAVANIVTNLAAGYRGKPPATITFVSGDVHYSYLAEASVPGGVSSVHQVVSSPIRNPLPTKIRLAVRVASLGITGAVGRVLARAARVRPTPVTWRFRRGYWFDNGLATMEFRGREASVRWDVVAPPAATAHEAGLRQLAAADLGSSD